MIRALSNRLFKNYVVNSFSTTDLKQWRSEWPEVPVSVFTEKELDFQGYAPSTFYAINHQKGTSLPIDKLHLKRQYEGDLVAQFAVLEGAVKNNYFGDMGWIDSKVHAFGKLSVRSQGVDEKIVFQHSLNGFPSAEMIAVSDDVHLPEELGVLDGYHPGKIAVMKDRLKWLYQLKQAYAQMIKAHSLEAFDSVGHQDTLERNNIGFVSDLKKLFGEDIGVVLFGSSTYGGKEFNDYDTVVLVDRIEEDFYRRLANNRIHWGGRDVDVVLVRKSDWHKYAVMNPFAMSILNKGILLEGTVSVPVINEQSAVLRAVSRAAGRIRTLHNLTLNWAAENPAELLNRQGLLRSVGKVPRYVLGALWQLRDLNEHKPYVFYGNEELDNALKSMGIVKHEGSASADELVENLFQIMVDTASVVDKLHKPSWIHAHKADVEKINEVTPEMKQRFDDERVLEKRLFAEWKLGELK